MAAAAVAVPSTQPEAFAKQISDRIGVYRTLGWAESADKGLQEGRLDEAAAGRFARLALDCVHREYPNKIAHVMNGDADAKTNDK